MNEFIALQLEEDAAIDAGHAYHLADTPRCALPDLRYVLAAGVVAVGALMAFANLLRSVRR
jgi:hypothetical protein